jgi:hypothetical protein
VADRTDAVADEAATRPRRKTMSKQPSNRRAGVAALSIGAVISAAIAGTFAAGVELDPLDLWLIEDASMMAAVALLVGIATLLAWRRVKSHA